MIESYRVGVSLLMDSGISGQLTGIIAQFEKLDRTGPIPVYVTNGRDIADGTGRHIANQGELPSAAPTGGDPRNTAPQPGWSWSLH